MAKDPAFLFYPSDWDGGTKLFDRHTKGAYLDLLLAQFHCGHMTSHEIAHVLGQADFNNLWESKLKCKFIQDNEGKFFNEKLENEQLKRKNWCASRNNNKDGKNQHSGHMTSHMSGHMVNENENKNKDKDRSKNINITNKKIFLPPTLEQVKEYCAERKNSVDPEMFIDFYASKNWMVGKNKMVDWKASLRRAEKWEVSEKVKQAQAQVKKSTCKRCFGTGSYSPKDRPWEFLTCDHR